jgi:hypothetical protein
MFETLKVEIILEYKLHLKSLNRLKRNKTFDGTFDHLQRKRDYEALMFRC